MALKGRTLTRSERTLALNPLFPRHNLERCLNWGNYRAGLARPGRTLSWLCHWSCGTPSQKRDNPSAMMEAHYLGDFSNDSLGPGGKALIDRVERPASPLAASLPARAGAAVLRGLHELAARLWSSLWLIVAVAVIMASLVVVAHLSLPFAIAAFLGFVASVALLPRQEIDDAEGNELARLTSSARSNSRMREIGRASCRERV